MTVTTPYDLAFPSSIRFPTLMIPTWNQIKGAGTSGWCEEWRSDDFPSIYDTVPTLTNLSKYTTEQVYHLIYLQEPFKSDIDLRWRSL